MQIKQTGLIAFDVVSKINGINIDLRSVIRKYALSDSEIEVSEFLRVVKEFDFKAKIKNFSPDNFVKDYPLPSIILNSDGSYSVLLKLDDKNKKGLIFSPVENKTKEISYEQIGENFIVLTHKIINQKIKFGFKWFFNEILTYKQVILEVLLGSFIVQLFGLVTPLFTQVILDKVIVHRSLITLNVLAFAFVAVMVFELLLNFARKYIFLHTACKIDAKLGAKIFNHLFALPFTYFEHRKVGNIITRVRELDQIREFITNKSISVILDLFFSFVFVIMMFLYSPLLTFAALGFVAAISLLYLIITPELRERLEKMFQIGAQSKSYLVESVAGRQSVTSLAIEG